MYKLCNPHYWNLHVILYWHVCKYTLYDHLHPERDGNKNWIVSFSSLVKLALAKKNPQRIALVVTQISFIFGVQVHNITVFK